jgi:hypothetical protein
VAAAAGSAAARRAMLTAVEAARTSEVNGEANDMIFS